MNAKNEREDRQDRAEDRTQRSPRELKESELAVISGGFLIKMKPVYISSYQSSGSSGG